MSTDQKRQRLMTGSIVSNKMDKTAVVLLKRQIKHPMYGKYITRTSKVHIHDENNECNMGDIVSITSCRPVSKTKSWKLVEIIEKN